MSPPLVSVARIFVRSFKARWLVLNRPSSLMNWSVKTNLYDELIHPPRSQILRVPQIGFV